MGDAGSRFPPSGQDMLEMLRVIPDVLFRCEKRADGKIQWTFNEGRLAEEFGVTTQQIEGKTLDDLFPGGGSGDLRQHFEDAFAGRPSEFINEIDGRYFKHSPQPILGPDGKVEALVGFITEVTESVQAQEVIKELNAEMMHRVIALNQANDALREANDGLRRANQDLDAFAHTVSHDLRSPLTVIENMCYLLRLKFAPTLGEDGGQMVDKVRSASRRMDRLIGDLLRFSRASRADLDLRQVDVTLMAQDIARQLDAQDGSIRVSWHIEEGLKACADEGLLRVALENLMGNAWKYSSRVAHPRVRVGGQEQDSKHLLVVEDNGIGFTAAEAKHVFAAFTRLEGAKSFEGTGIGLATVQRIMDRHGGRVWAEPAQPGARFMLWLPGEG